MRKNKFTDADIDTIASAMKWVFSNVAHEIDGIYSKPPAQKVIACVLSLGTNYEGVVPKRLRKFEENHPDVNSITDLEKLIAGYSTPYEFFVKELDHKKKIKASTINELVKFFRRTIRKSPTLSEEEALEQWAIKAKPEDYLTLNIKGCRIACFQWLRMLFGADTAKPDVHIVNFLSENLGKKVSKIEAVYLMEKSASRASISTQLIDHLIWRMKAKWKSVRIAPDLYDAFDNEISINKALQSSQKGN